MTEINTILLQLLYDRDRCNTVLVALAISELVISYNDGDRYNTVLVALAISELVISYDDRDRYNTVLVALAIPYDGDRSRYGEISC